jgi:hypothetical protein
VPLPLFDTLIVWLIGRPAFAAAENDSEVGVTLIVGATAELTV